MQSNHTTETLSKQVEKIVLANISNSKLPQEKIRDITEKFKNKTLSELHDFVMQLKTPK